MSQEVFTRRSAWTDERRWQRRRREGEEAGARGGKNEKEKENDDGGEGSSRGGGGKAAPMAGLGEAGYIYYHLPADRCGTDRTTYEAGSVST